VWLNEQALDRGRSYLIKHTTQLARIDVEAVESLLDLETLEEKPANRIEMNDIGQITISAHNKMFLDPYQKNIATGAFIIIDPISNNTVAAGMVVGPAPEQTRGLKEGVKLPASKITVEQRAQALGQKGATVLITGLPAAGKSEIAYELEKQLFDLKKHALVVDPDDGVGRTAPLDGSSPVQTPEFALRATNAGIISIFTYAMPLRADRASLRDAVGRERFVEVFASASLEACKKRDVRGLYGPNHPDPSYERPQEADVELDLSQMSEGDAARAIIATLKKKNLL
jgi:bifunctional enzyme CysN/CysC